MADLVIEPAGSDDYTDDDDAFNNETMAGGSANDKKLFLYLIDQLPNVTKAAGDLLRLKCHVDGTPPIEFQWFLNEARLVREKGRITVKNRDYWSRLRISELRVLDAGYYRCEASNRWGRVQTTSVVTVSSNVGKNRQNADLQTFNHRARPPIEQTNNERIKDTCQVYNGEACKNYLAGVKVYIHTDDPEELLDIERHLQAAFIVINNSSQVSEPCKIFAQRASCYHRYQVCDSKSSNGGKQSQLLSICRNHCTLLETDLCQDEYSDARVQSLVGPPPALLPDCKFLPDNNENCIEILDRLEEAEETHSCYVGNGNTYRGTASVTETGNECDKWVNARRLYPQYKSSKYLELTGNNFCRNPDGSKPRPWCVTKEGKEEYCNINVCPPGFFPRTSSNDKNSPVGGGGVDAGGDQNSSKDTGIFGIPTQYVFMTAGIVGVLLIALLIAGIYKCVQSKKDKKKKVSAANGHCANGIRKPQQCVPTPDHQIEMMHLIGQRTPFVPPTELPPEISLSNVQFLEPLGEGQFGKVWKGAIVGYGHEDEPLSVALKTLKEDASPRQKKEFEQEAAIVARLRHPNIVELIGVCLTAQPQCMIFEFIMHGDLHELLLLRSPYSQMATIDNERILFDHGDFLQVAIQIAAGMEYLAVNHYVHRDLAARNCIVADRLVIKISDFGVTRDVYASDYYLCQSKKYLPIRWMPPESIFYGKFNELTDVWSFGVTLWEMYSYGTQPYYGYSNAEVLNMVRQRCLLECPDNCPPRMYSLMVECWHETASRRPRFAELHARLQTWSVVSSPAHSTVNTSAAAAPLQNGAVRSGSVLSGNSSGHLSSSGACNVGGGGIGPQQTAPPSTVTNGSVCHINGIGSRNSPYGRPQPTPAGVSPSTIRVNGGGGGYSVRNAAATYGFPDHSCDSASSVS